LKPLEEGQVAQNKLKAKGRKKPVSKRGKQAVEKQAHSKLNMHSKILAQEMKMVGVDDQVDRICPTIPYFPSYCMLMLMHTESVPVRQYFLIRHSTLMFESAGNLQTRHCQEAVCWRRSFWR
jgi:hypothetical protein